MLTGVNSMKIKGTLDALKNSINYLILDDHVCALTLEYCKNLHWCSYFLVQCSRTELLSKILWKRIPPAIVMQYQNKCLQAIIQLFNHDDYRVRQASVTAFSDFVKNAVFGDVVLFGNDCTHMLGYHNLIKIHEADKNEGLPNIQLQQNVCYALEILSDQCFGVGNQAADNLVILLYQYVSKTNALQITYVQGIEALIANHSLRPLLDNWFSNPSISAFQNSLIFKLIEVSASNITVDNLVTILNVLSFLLEKREANEKETVEQANNIPSTKSKLKMRVVLVYLR